uniref:FBD domain-containing protein n=1 Tax=Aegilops tauschii subsp. strangulata TaxID=200361 RepID=A0A452ZF61_AEGTS
MQMFYLKSSGASSGEVVGMRRHDHLKTVFMSGFRCYRAQTELACCILGNACVLEQRASVNGHRSSRRASVR